MKKVYFLLLPLIYCFNSHAQVTGVKNIPGDYASLSAAITALNTTGVGAGGATINLTAGYAETAPAGGFQLGNTLLNASTSSTNPLKFVGLGNNIITAQTGTSTTLDGIFIIKGTDYVTLDGLTFKEAAANTTATTAMEYAIAMFNLNSTAPLDGCQNNTIKNCTITLNRTIATPSKAVFVAHQVAASTTALLPAIAGDLHSNNSFYSNTISNVITAFYLGGATSMNDTNNDIGGTSAATGNSITNVIGALYSSVGAITCTYQTNTNISYNTINNTSNGGTNAIATAWAIYAYGPSCTYTVNNNNITLVESSISTAYAIYGIYGNAALANITAQNNSVDITETTGSSAVNDIAIFLPNGNNTSITGNIVKQTMGVSGTTYGIYITSTGTASVNSNTLTQTASVATSSQFYSIVSGGTGVSESIQNNIFLNTNVSTAGTLGYLALIYTSNGTGNKTITGNIISGTVTHTSSSDLYCILANPAAAAGAGTATIANNNFSGITKTGTGGLYGIYYAPTVASTLQNYDFHDNTFSNISGGATVAPVYFAAGNTANIYQNNISGITSAGNVFGIYQTTPNTVTANIYKNQVNGLSTTGTATAASGVTVASGATTTIHNNFIRNLQAANANAAADGVRGISLTSNTASSAINVYYNTISLNATSVGTNFSTSGIYHAASATATTAALDMRNNIIVNTSTANGTGTSAAFRRSGTALANYSSSSNNNLFYCGTPSAAKLIYADGTNFDQTLAAYQARVTPADAASISVQPNFVSATDLHLTGLANCAIDGKATPIASYTTDFDGDTRNASTPDIGADEFVNTFVLTITNPPSVCAPSTVDITAAAVTAGSSAGTLSYWMDAAATVAIPAGNGTPNAITTSGTYYIKSDNGIGCSDVKPVVVSIGVSASATISYTGSPYCQNAGTATVTRTGTAGGTYSSTTGLVINATTGDITLGSSTPGTYTVNYGFVAGGSCPAANFTTTVTITAAPNATISYTGSPYCQNAGTATITQTGTTGGTYSSTTGLTINASTGAVTTTSSTPGTYTVTYTVAAAGGCAVYTTTTSVTITATPNATISYAGSPYCQNAGTATVTQTGTTGGTYSSTTGLTINASTGAVTTTSSTPGTYTVTYTVAAAGGCAVFTTTASITITAAPAATISYAGSPYCQNAGTATVTQTGTTGGTYSSTTGLTINASTGAVTTTSSTAGTYTVTYTVAAAGGCAVYTTTTSITITATPNATISYAGSPYCPTGTATVTRTGTTGGTYSSTTGLSINAATGDVNLAASTPGSYTVTYTVAAAGGCAVFTTTSPIVVNTLSVAATGATTSVATSCGPVSATLNVTGGSLGTGASWKWYSTSCGGTAVGTGASITVNVAATTTYYVRAEGTCNSTACASVTVTINPIPTVSLTAAPFTSLMPGMFTTLTANISPVVAGNTIVWYKNNTVVNNATGTTLAVSVDDLGSYTASVTSPFGCASALSAPLVIKDSATGKLFISPNPNNGVFKVRYYTNNTSFGFLRRLLIYDAKGALVFNKNIPITAPYSSMDVDMRKNGKGIYTVVVFDFKGNQLAQSKVVIQ
ncbi:Ig-like domain-containing protein [Ferruginibacter sp.]